ncbi:MAG TPA: hypothetical protein VK508_18740 [Cyclobacteriaceae bacterium]|nr:hypothetical protein [Cyclobacteriaceae bacterium]
MEIVEEKDNPAFPYRICHQCYDRLMNLALRPREYFNLTAEHGMTFLLHDDFYGDDGEATQPKIDVDEGADLAFPVLTEIRDVKTLIDYAIVKWWVSHDIVDAFRQFEKEVILQEFDKRIQVNRMLAHRLYELAAKVLGIFAGSWILKQWEFRTGERFPDYAEALAKCLPPGQGVRLFIEELNKIDKASKLSEYMVNLIHFQSESSLTWIESNVHRVKNISTSWGYVAVASKFSWPVAGKWLASGRPLSLVALDALSNCAVTSNTLNSLPWLRAHPQKLLDPANIDEMNQVLLSYSAGDHAPRVRSNVDYIMDNWGRILKT